MEPSSSKFKFLVIVLCAILQLPGGPEARPLFHENRDQCGKPSVDDLIAPGEQVAREMPWVVVVKADVGRESRTCTGTIITPRLVLTSKFCAPRESENTRYVVQWGEGRHKSVAAAHTIEGTPLIVLEVASPPFRSDFAVCLPFGMAAKDLNKTVLTATWVNQESSHPMFNLGFVHKERWTITEKCERTCDPLTDRCTCALVGGVCGSVCGEDEGKPVLRWAENKWYLIGLVTNVHLASGKCVRVGRKERVFETITDEDTVKIRRIVKPNLGYYLPDVKPETESELQRPTCGLGDDLPLGREKKLAPFLLPGVVAVHGRHGGRILNCMGVLVSVRYVLTAKDCVPKGSDITRYTVTHNSVDLTTGFKIKVGALLDPKPFGKSFVILELEREVIQETVACLASGPFEHPGQSVVAPSWAFNDVGGKFEKNQLYYEKWILPRKAEACDDDDKVVKERHNNSLIICALFGTDAYQACKGDLGQPVMQYRNGNWYLLGMVIHVDVGKTDCEPRQNRKRVFEWITRDNA